MTWYEDMILARIIAEERIAPRRRREYRMQTGINVVRLRPWMRAVLSWLF